jgi:hypothetical protein
MLSQSVGSSLQSLQVEIVYDSLCDCPDKDHLGMYLVLELIPLGQRNLLENLPQFSAKPGGKAHLRKHFYSFDARLDALSSHITSQELTFLQTINCGHNTSCPMLQKRLYSGHYQKSVRISDEIAYTISSILQILGSASLLYPD